MRRALLAIALLLSGCEQALLPSTAEGIQRANEFTARSLELVQKIHSGADADEIAADTQTMLAALYALEALQRPALASAGPARDPIKHLSALKVAEIRACTSSYASLIGDIDKVRKEIQRVWAMDAAGCAIRAGVYLDVVSDRRIANELGFAINTIYPVALVARATAGLKIEGLLQEYRSSNDKLVARLAPRATESTQRAQALELTSGEVALAVQPMLERLASTEVAAKQAQPPP